MSGPEGTRMLAMSSARALSLAHRRATLKIDRENFAAYFDKQPFYIEHDLSGHPLFELEAMADLSRRLPSYLVEGEYGESGRPPPRPCPEAIMTVAENPTWVLLRQIQEDPAYGAL